MGKAWSDASLPVVTDVVTGDKLLILRESDGANGSKIITVDDFEQSSGDMIGKYIYNIAGQMLTPQPGSAVLMIHKAPVAFDILTGSDLSVGVADIAATNDTTLSIRKNGSEVGTMGINAGTGAVAFNWPGDVSFAAGDKITVINQASPDPTLALLAWSICGRR